MLVQNDTDALVSIDMPAGPSEVLVSDRVLYAVTASLKLAPGHCGFEREPGIRGC
jgi:hypothetical protein